MSAYGTTAADLVGTAAGLSSLVVLAYARGTTTLYVLSQHNVPSETVSCRHWLQSLAAPHQPTPLPVPIFTTPELCLQHASPPIIADPCIMLKSAWYSTPVATICSHMVSNPAHQPCCPPPLPRSCHSLQASLRGQKQLNGMITHASHSQVAASHAINSNNHDFGVLLARCCWPSRPPNLKCFSLLKIHSLQAKGAEKRLTQPIKQPATGQPVHIADNINMQQHSPATTSTPQSHPPPHLVPTPHLYPSILNTSPNNPHQQQACVICLSAEGTVSLNSSSCCTPPLCPSQWCHCIAATEPNAAAAAGHLTLFPWRGLGPMAGQYCSPQPHKTLFYGLCWHTHKRNPEIRAWNMLCTQFCWPCRCCCCWW